ncbi:SDR family NAD(P)-dependent oxidoreductase [Streptomyces sp. NBC_01102]|uniref:SDR family NAD(P)-dependent oxidoreductase n=1 Tax=unclassified Streptomyces TaxID=2593676 RepID=UPI0038702599|nr:SDR family NAD(P)-dependent oxidoreductase [Streptomyces sp. NBC_01102]
MKAEGARVPVAGATGVIGAALAAGPGARGVRLVLDGRNEERLTRRAPAPGGAPTVLFDAYAPDSCARAVHATAGEHGGLDAVLTAFGSVAVGKADAVGDDIAEHLMAVSALAPAAFFRAALGTGGTIAAITGVVAERPQPGMADYSASRSARHLDTGLADRAVAGHPPPVPQAVDPGAAVHTAVEALAADAERARTDSQGITFLGPRVP